MSQEHHNPSPVHAQLPGSQPETLAELAVPSASPDMRRGVVVATAEAWKRPPTHARLLLKDQEEQSAENLLLRGLHYMDWVAADLNEAMQYIAKKEGDNLQEFIDMVKPKMAAFVDLQAGVGLLSNLVAQDSGGEQLHSREEAKALFGAKSSRSPEEAIVAFDENYGGDTLFGKFVAGYDFDDFGEKGVRASSLMAAFLEEILVQHTIAYREEVKPQEVMVDSLGVERLLLPLDTMNQNIPRIFGNIASPEHPRELEADDEASRMKKKNQLYSLVIHEWRTPITSLKLILNMMERAVHPEEGKEPNLDRARELKKSFIRLVSPLEDIRQRMFDALQKGFVPTEISRDPVEVPLEQMVAVTQQQLGFWLGDRMVFGNSDSLPEGAMVNIPTSTMNGIINNAVQNAQRSLQARLMKEEGVPAREAEERARNEVYMACWITENKRGDRARIFITDNGGGIPQDDNGEDIAQPITDNGDGSSKQTRRTYRFPPEDHGYGIEGVESHGLVMKEYAAALRSLGAEFYLLQTQPGIGATLVVSLPLKMTERAAS